MPKTILKIFRGWGQLYARAFKLDKNTIYPVNLAQCIGFIGPKIHEMNLSVEDQSELIHSFLLGAMDIFDSAINSELNQDH